MGLDTQAARLRRGDPDAFDELLRQYQHRLYRYLTRLAGDSTVADDLFQQTWLRVVEKIRHYDEGRSFEAWLFAVARNLAMDHFRRYKPESLDEPVGNDPAGETKESMLPGNEPSALERVMDRERSEYLAGALQRLPVMYREVLTLRFEEEMKLEEIAGMLRVPLSTAKTRLRRGLEQLKSETEKTGARAAWR